MSTPGPDVAARLRATAEQAPDRIALAWHDQTVTYGELDARVDAAAGGLQHLGVQPGDRVAVLLGNVPAFVEAYFGALRAGATAVPLTLGLAPDEVAHALTDSGASVLVVAAVAADDVVDLGLELDVTVLVAGADEAPPGASRWRDLLDEAHPLDPVERHDDDLGALVYTSGTTGRPRGAMLTRGNLTANQDQSLAGRFRVAADDVVLLVLPLSHIYALNVGLGACVRVGAAMLLQERFDPTTSLDAIEQYGVTIVLGAPPMYVAWNNTPGVEERDLSSLRLASPAPPRCRSRSSNASATDRAHVEEGYGLTEAGPSVTSNSMAPVPAPGTVGMPLPDIDLRLVQPDGSDAAVGDPGEVWSAAPTSSPGTGTTPRPPRRPWTTGGCAPATSASWTRTATCAWSTARTTRSSSAASTSIPARSNGSCSGTRPSTSARSWASPHPYTGEAVRPTSCPTARSPRTSWPCLPHPLARYKCPERSSWSTRCRTPRRARSAAPPCGTRCADGPAGQPRGLHRLARCSAAACRPMGFRRSGQPGAAGLDDLAGHVLSRRSPC